MKVFSLIYKKIKRAGCIMYLTKKTVINDFKVVGMFVAGIQTDIQYMPENFSGAIHVYDTT
jgi:hypothetical protein